MLIQPLQEELWQHDVSQRCLSRENLFQGPSASQSFLSKDTDNGRKGEFFFQTDT